MSLARITERIQEEKDKEGKIDGRRFNSRSQKKMIWQVKDLQRNLKRQKKTHVGRGSYSKEELEEYKLINIQERKESGIRLDVKNIVTGIIDKIVDDLD